MDFNPDNIFTIKDRKSYSQVLETISKVAITQLSHDPNITYNTSLQVPGTLILAQGQIQSWFYTDKFSISARNKLRTKARVLCQWDHFASQVRTHRVERDNLAIVRIAKGIRGSYHLLKDSQINTVLAAGYNRAQWECVYDYIPHKVNSTQKGALYLVLYHRSKKPDLEFRRANFANKEGLLYDLEAAEREEKRLKANFYISSQYRTNGTSNYQRNFYHAFLDNEPSRALSINLQLESAAKALIAMLESKRDQRVKTMAMEFLRDSNGGLWLIYVRKLTVLLCEWSEEKKRENRGLRAQIRLERRCVSRKYCEVQGGEAGEEEPGPKYVQLKDLLLDEIECKPLSPQHYSEADPLALANRTCNSYLDADIQTLIVAYPHLRPSNYYSQKPVCDNCYFVYLKLAIERNKHTSLQGLVLPTTRPLSQPPLAPSHHAQLRLSEQLSKLQQRVQVKKSATAASLRSQFCPYLGSGKEEKQLLESRGEALMRRLMSQNSA